MWDKLGGFGTGIGYSYFKYDKGYAAILRNYPNYKHMTQENILQELQ